MNKLLILAIVINFTVITFPQQQKKYFDAPFGGGVGYVPGWYIPNLDPVNVELKSHFLLLLHCLSIVLKDHCRRLLRFFCSSSYTLIMTYYIVKLICKLVSQIKIFVFSNFL